MPVYPLHHIFQFEKTSQHPDSKIVGVDHYDFSAKDGIQRQWQSYTLVPVSESDIIPPYDRWYIVDLPDLGLSFVRIINETDMPESPEVEDKLTGIAVMQTEGNGDLGTGTSDLITYWDKSVSPPAMYAAETFEDGSTLYFKTVPLQGLKHSL